MLVPTLLSESALRARMETAFSQGRLEDALVISRLLDQLQIKRIQQEMVCTPVAV